MPSTDCSGTDNKTEWVEAHITKATGEGTQIKLDIAYNQCEKDQKENMLPYPNPRIADCGKQLKTRNNCSELEKIK